MFVYQQPESDDNDGLNISLILEQLSLRYNIAELRKFTIYFNSRTVQRKILNQILKLINQFGTLD